MNAFHAVDEWILMNGVFWQLLNLGRICILTSLRLLLCNKHDDEEYVVNFPIDELKEATFLCYLAEFLTRFLYAKTKEASIETVWNHFSILEPF